MTGSFKNLLAIAVAFLLGGGVVALLWSVAAGPAKGPRALYSISDFALLDEDGVSHQLSRYGDARAFVVVTHGLGCNIVTKGAGVLRDLQERYEPGVRFFYLNANPQDDRDELAAHVEELGLTIPILEDDAQVILDELQATRTAEAFLIDAATRGVVFRGPIDDRLDYEAEKPQASASYLADAIDNLLAGRSVAPAPMESPGCLITRNASTESPTYTEHVASILERRCVVCHQKGAIGPWEMDGFETVRGWSAMMKEVLLTRRMPPWPADPHYGTFENSLAASTDEVDTLVRWIRDGSPRGPGQDPLEALAPDSVDWPMGPPDKILSAPEQTIPALGVLDYRFVKMEVAVDEDMWLRAVDLQPTNRAVVHHMFAFVDYPDHLKHLEPPWNHGEIYFALYGPGTPSIPFPEGTGSWIPAGSKIDLQLHYTTMGVETTDTPRLGLYLHEGRPEKEIRIGVVHTQDFVVPPGAAHVPVTATVDMDEDVTLYGLLVHMHYRGKEARFETRLPDGRRERLLSVPAYNFNWQLFYQLDEPVKLPRGTQLVYSGSFDNSAANPLNPDPNDEVRFGIQSWDEMFVGYYAYSRDAEGVAVARGNPGS